MGVGVGSGVDIDKDLKAQIFTKGVFIDSKLGVTIISYYIVLCY